MGMFNSNINAGIVTYNPDIRRLEKNIESIFQQVEEVIIIDNHSSNVGEIEKLCLHYPNVYIQKNEKNLGIAVALNQIFSISNNQNKAWVYTLDQDTISSVDIISGFSKLTRDDVGIISPYIFEEGLGQELKGYGSKKYKDMIEPYEVDTCITSGALTNIKAWKQVRGFDEYMFIDYVDFDFSISLREAGYKIMKVPNFHIYHELGDTKMIHIWKWNIRVTKHSPMRKYYMGRNIIYFCKKHKEYASIPIEILRLFKIELFILLFENHKLKQQREFFNGIKDGIIRSV